MTKLFVTIACALAALAPAYGRDSNSDIVYGADAPTYTLARTALDARSVPFANHSANAPFGSYLQQTLDFAPFKKLFDQVNATEKTLKSRGEAHITVVTPPEFDQVLKPAGITIQEIEAIAKARRIQSARLRPVCLGRFKASLPTPASDADKGQFTLYSLVVADVHGDLLAIRQDIYKLFRKRGGEGALFQPEAFWPHVTMGFDRRDLFITDGVYKGSNYCYAPIRLSKN
ncbi:hypothetical protein EC988_003590 [Linderina pennispora]|nr:hypothetical protein EC988_003590 [Linderina pennispora]